MKIAYVITTFPSRTETFAAREIECLRQEGIEISVFSAAPATGLPREEGVLYRPRFFSSEAWRALLYLWRRPWKRLLPLARMVCQLTVRSPRQALTTLRNVAAIGAFAKGMEMAGIEHVHAYWLSWPACIAVALRVVTGRTMSVASHARDIFVPGERGRLQWKIAGAKFVTTCTQQGLEHLTKRVLPAEAGKLHLVRHGVLWREIPLDVSRHLRTSNGGPAILAVGRLVPKKGFQYLIRAVAQLEGEHSRCKLAILGDGPELEPLQTLAKQLGIQDRIVFAGWQSHDAVMKLLGSSPILAAPSIVAGDGDRDGTPNVILEAFARGAAVVASSLSGIREAVEHNKTGLLVEPGDVPALAGAIAALLASGELRTRLCRSALEVLTLRFDAHQNARQLAGLFEEARR